MNSPRLCTKCFPIEHNQIIILIIKNALFLLNVSIAIEFLKKFCAFHFVRVPNAIKFNRMIGFNCLRLIEPSIDYAGNYSTRNIRGLKRVATHRNIWFYARPYSTFQLEMFSRLNHNNLFPKH